MNESVFPGMVCELEASAICETINESIDKPDETRRVKRGKRRAGGKAHRKRLYDREEKTKWWRKDRTNDRKSLDYYYNYKYCNRKNIQAIDDCRDYILWERQERAELEEEISRARRIAAYYGDPIQQAKNVVVRLQDDIRAIVNEGYDISFFLFFNKIWDDSLAEMQSIIDIINAL